MTYTQVWDHMQDKLSDQMIVRDEGNEPTPYTPPPKAKAKPHG